MRCDVVKNQNKENSDFNELNFPSNQKFVVLIKNNNLKKCEINFNILNKKLAEYFKNDKSVIIKLKSFNFSKNGTLFLHLNDEISMNFIMQNWKSDIFGNNTSIHKYEPGANIISNTKFQYTSALIIYIPPNFPENIVLNNIKNNYNSVINVKRFIKNFNILDTIKIDFFNNIQQS